MRASLPTLLRPCLDNSSLELFTKEEYTKVQDVRRGNQLKSRDDITQYTFTHITYSSCGGKFAENPFEKTGKYYRYYRCEKCKIRYPAKTL